MKLEKLKEECCKFYCCIKGSWLLMFIFSFNVYWFVLNNCKVRDMFKWY